MTSISADDIIEVSLIPKDIIKQIPLDFRVLSDMYWVSGAASRGGCNLVVGLAGGLLQEGIASDCPVPFIRVMVKTRRLDFEQYELISLGKYLFWVYDENTIVSAYPIARGKYSDVSRIIDRWVQEIREDKDLSI